MPLILTEPAATGIKKYKNGVKVYRLHEWLGPARGTLTTVSDPWSVCGTVVKDTQTVAYSGTSPNQTIATIAQTAGGASDTIRIQREDLELGTTFFYTVYLGVRCEGTVDPTKKNATHKFLEIGSNAAAVFGAHRQSDFSDWISSGVTRYAPKPITNKYYKVIPVAGVLMGDNFFNNEDDYFVLRACTGTGGSGFAWYLDVMYLVPIGPLPLQDHPYESGDFRQIMHNADFDPIFDRTSNTWDHTKDNDPPDPDVIDGQYSVMVSAPPGFGSGSICMADFQEEEDENTTADVNGNGMFPNFKDPDKSSDLTIVFGSHWTGGHEVDFDGFGRTLGPVTDQFLGETNEGRVYGIHSDDPLESSGPGSGFGCNGSELVFALGKYNDVLPFAQGEHRDVALIVYGSTGLELGTGATTKGHEVVQGMEFSQIHIKTKMDNTLVAGFDWLFGYSASAEFMGVILSIPRGSHAPGAWAPSTTLTAELAYLSTMHTSRSLRNTIDGPVTMTTTYSPNTWIHIRVEKMFYRYRAKVWFDGDDEPEDWMLDGYIPAFENVGGGGHDYPYTSGDTFHGRSRRSFNTLFPSMGVGYYPPVEDINGQDSLFSSQPVKLTTTYWDDFEVDFHDYGEDISDVHLKNERYDEELDMGHVIVPFESQRVIISPTAKHSFNDDTDGFILSAWKNEDAPPTQAAVISEVHQKIIRAGPIHLHLRFRPWELTDFEGDEEEP